MSLQGIFDNPLDLLLPVLNRMNARTLCRFRQTNKGMDKFVETNRRLITSFHDLTAYAKNHFICGSYHSLVMCVRRCDKFTYNGLYDPYKQLSAINCRRLGMDFQRDDDNVDPAVFAATLKKFNFKCKKLLITRSTTAEINVILTSNMAIKEVELWPTIVLSDLQKWPIQHLKCVFRIEKFDHLSTHVKAFRDIFLKPYKVQEDDVKSWLSEFLTEVRASRDARGRLEHLRIEYGKASLVEEYHGLRLLCRGYSKSPRNDSRWCCSEIYKMEIDDGFALVIRRSRPSIGNEDDTHIYFLNRDDRESLFNAFSSYNAQYFQTVDGRWDIEGEKDDFLKAKDDETAFMLLFPKKQPTALEASLRR